MTRLDELIPQYASNKNEMDAYKKLCDKENAEIKSIMKDLALQKYEAGEYKAIYTISKRETMDEEILLEIAHQFGIPEIVKTKEYIDFDALENAIYNGKISPEILTEMDRARSVKEVVTLRISKKKGDSNE